MAGNYEAEKAIELVDKMRSIMSLESAKLEVLPHLRGIALESGTSFLVEKALTDEKNENSTAIVYYEVGVRQDNLREDLVNDVVMQFMSEPFFD